MNRIISAIIMLIMSAPLYAQFPYNTSTGAFSTVVTPTAKDFSWNWTGYADQKIYVTFNATGMQTVVFRMASPNGGDAYLTVYGGSIISNLGNGKTLYSAIIPRTNVPPARSYKAEFLAANISGTNYTPSALLARGDITVQWSAFNATNQMVYTNTALVYISSGGTGSGTLYRVESQVSGLGFNNPNGPTAILTGTVSAASGTFTNLSWNGNANTTQAIVLGESNVVLRYTGGTSYVGMASSITGDMTFNGAINANDHLEIANTKHLRFQDGGGTNTVHLEAVKGRLIITGAIDIVSGQAVPATVNGSAIATGTPLYVQSETNAEARLASNVWAEADSTTNYALRTTAITNDSFSINGIKIGTGSNIVIISTGFVLAVGGAYTASQNNVAFEFNGANQTNAYAAGTSLGGRIWLGMGDVGSPKGGDVIIAGGAGAEGPGDIYLGGTPSPFAGIVYVNGSIVQTNGTISGSFVGVNSGALTNLGSGLALSGGKLTVTNVVTASSWAAIMSSVATSRGNSNDIIVSSSGLYNDSLTTYSGSSLTNFALMWQTWMVSTTQVGTAECEVLLPLGFSSATNISFKYNASIPTGTISAVVIATGTAGTTQTITSTSGTVNLPLAGIGANSEGSAYGLRITASGFSTNAANFWQLGVRNIQWQK